MQINEIFSSIDGEGIRTGYLATFIRTQFCNLRCDWGLGFRCDTTYSWEANDENGNPQYKDMTILEIIDKCVEYKNKRITFTGGEPLIQPDALELINALTKEGFEVNVETNGAVDLKSFIDADSDNKVIYTMDWKSPCSKMRDKMVESNLEILRENDVLKFVVSNKEDLDDMKGIISKYNLKCHIFVSPVFSKINLPDIVDYMKENNLQNVRMQLQMHKIVWSPEIRGV